MAPTPSTRPLEQAWGPLTRERLAPLLAPPGRALPRPVLAGLGGAASSGGVTALLERARADRGSPWPQPTATSWARLHRDGNRVAHEALAFAHTHRLTRAVLAAAVASGDDPLDPLVDEVADGVLLLCERSTWCWPAHDHAHRLTGSVLPDVTDPVLDLGAGEVAAQLAWTDHLLGDLLDVRWPGLRGRVRHEVRRRVLDPFLTRRDWSWTGREGDVDNWNPWIHGNVLAAALALLDGTTEDDDERRAEVVARALQGLDLYVAALPADGATDEGFDYWFEGACRALEALDLVRHATGGALDWTAVPALRATTGFPGALHLGGLWHASFSDSRARTAPGLPWRSLHAAARRAGDEDAAAHAAATAATLVRAGQPALDERSGLARSLATLTDRDWWRALDQPPAPPLPRGTWHPSVQVLLARLRAGSAAGLALAVKGGHNGEHHNHLDVGSAVVALGGVPVLVDPGRPSYDAHTFGPRRYEAWPATSAWHGVPELRGTSQGVGRHFAARHVSVVDDDDGAALSLDLAGAHPACGVARWWRTARLDRRAGTVVLTDAWQLDGSESAESGPRNSALHLVLAGEVALGDGRAAVDALDGAGRVLLEWDGDVVAASLAERVLDDPVLTAVWGQRLTRLRLELAGVHTGEVRVTLTPARRP